MTETRTDGVDIGDVLRAPLDDGLVKHLDDGPSRGAPYLETYVAINQANAIFGFDGWDYSVTRLERVA